MTNMILRFQGTSKCSRSFFISLAVFFSIINLSFAQDLYGLENSTKYANYLMLSEQYKLAAEEYERLVFLDSANIGFKSKLVQAYRNSGNFSLALDRVNRFSNGNILSLPKSLAQEYLSTLLLINSSREIDFFLKNNKSIDQYHKNIFNWSNLTISGEYTKAQKEIQFFAGKKDKLYPEMQYITKYALSQKHKSSFLAGSLSTIVPGLGKVYTENYLDGVISLLFIAGTAWQSYRGFNKSGINSVSGWIFGGISFGFYLGNIYGSSKSAKRFNKLKIDDTNKKVYNFIQSNSF